MKLLIIVVIAGLCSAQSESPNPTSDASPSDPTIIDTSTTKPPDTTSQPETTPTSAPDTTTSAGTTTSAPITDTFYSVKAGPDSNVNCIMFSGDFKLNVDYLNNEGKKLGANVDLPAPSASSGSSGSCGGNDTPAFITINWGNGNSFSMYFNASADKYELIEVQMKVKLDQDKFSGSPDVGKDLDVKGQLPGLSFVPVNFNHSMTCRSNVESSNFTASVAGSNSTYGVTANALGFHFEAYNSIDRGNNFAEGDRCSNDLTSDLVPIAVGVALAALVFLVLVSYLIGRRRRGSPYESV